MVGRREVKIVMKKLAYSRELARVGVPVVESRTPAYVFPVYVHSRCVESYSGANRPNSRVDSDYFLRIFSQYSGRSLFDSNSIYSIILRIHSYAMSPAKPNEAVVLVVGACGLDRLLVVPKYPVADVSRFWSTS